MNEKHVNNESFGDGLNETFKEGNFEDENFSTKIRQQINENLGKSINQINEFEYENRNTSENTKIIETGNNNLDQAIEGFEKEAAKDGDFPTFGVTEPIVVQTNQLIISPTQPTLEKPLKNEKFAPDDVTQSKDELMSPNTMKFTVNSLLDSIMNEAKPPPQPLSNDTSQDDIPVIFNKPKEDSIKNDDSGRNSKSNSRQNSLVRPLLDLSGSKQDQRREELMKRRQRQEEASSRLAQPKMRPVRVFDEDATPRKTRSIAEQRDAADRLSQPKTIVKDFYPPNPEYRPKKKVHVIKQKTSTSQRNSPENQRLYGPVKKATQTDERREKKDTTTRQPPKATKEFKELFNGPKPKKPTPAQQAMLTARTREIESTKSPEEIKEIVEKIINKKKNEKIPIYDDPATIADIVNDLTNRRINALNDSDYIQSLKLQKLAEEVRTQFRIRDREHFHEDYMRELNNKLVITKNAMKQSEEEWTIRMRDFDDMCKRELNELDNRQDEEMRELEDKWQSPEAQRRFSKKSPQLLSQQAREKNMALIGDMVGAHEMSKLVKKTEKKEATQKYEDMMMTFEKDRANLIVAQDNARSQMEAQQAQKRNNLQKRRDEINNQYKKRIQALERVIKDDSDIEKFCAKKFKRNADCVIPMSATTVGGDDIPTTGKMRAAPLNLNGLISYRENNTPAPLQLPTLRFKRAKSVRARRKPETTKKEEF